MTLIEVLERVQVALVAGVPEDAEVYGVDWDRTSISALHVPGTADWWEWSGAEWDHLVDPWKPHVAR